MCRIYVSNRWSLTYTDSLFTLNLPPEGRLLHMAPLRQGWLTQGSGYSTQPSLTSLSPAISAWRLLLFWSGSSLPFSISEPRQPWKPPWAFGWDLVPRSPSAGPPWVLPGAGFSPCTLGGLTWAPKKKEESGARGQRRTGARAARRRST